MRAVFWTLLAIAIPFVGYGIMHGLAYLLPMGENTDGSYWVFTLLIIFLGLLVPYLMLKAGLLKAHTANKQEKELRLRDFPKDRAQISREQGSGAHS